MLTAIGSGAAPTDLAELLLPTETDRAFADTGHSFDFINKAFECLDLIGWEYAPLRGFGGACTRRMRRRSIQLA